MKRTAKRSLAISGCAPTAILAAILAAITPVALAIITATSAGAQDLSTFGVLAGSTSPTPVRPSSMGMLGSVREMPLSAWPRLRVLARLTDRYMPPIRSPIRLKAGTGRISYRW